MKKIANAFYILLILAISCQSFAVSNHTCNMFLDGSAEMNHTDMVHSKMAHSEIDHSEIDHLEMDHSNMDQSDMSHHKMQDRAQHDCCDSDCKCPTQGLSNPTALLPAMIELNKVDVGSLSDSLIPSLLPANNLELTRPPNFA